MKGTVLIILIVAVAIGMGVRCSRQCRRDVIVVNPNDQSVNFHVLFRESERRWGDSFPLKPIAGHKELKVCKNVPTPNEMDDSNEMWIAEMNGREIFREQLSWHDLERRNFRIELPLVN